MLSRLAVALLAIPAVLAQNTTGIPNCAVQCVLTTLPSSPCATYGVSNLTCICTSTAFQAAYYQCQTQQCNATELQAAEVAGAQQCESIGHPINITAIPSGVSSAAASTTTAAASSAGSSSSAASSSSSAPATTSKSAASSLVRASLADGHLAGLVALGLALVGGVAVLL